MLIWMRWLDSLTYSMGLSFSKLWEMVMDRQAWHAVVHGLAKSQTWLSDWTTACLFDEASINIPEAWVERTSRRWIHPCPGRVVDPNFTGTEAPVLRTLLEFALYTSSSECSSIGLAKIQDSFGWLSVFLTEQNSLCPPFIPMIPNWPCHHSKLLWIL